MRDFGSCFSEYALHVSDTSCSNYTNNPCVSPNSISTPSIQNTVTCLYRTILCSDHQKQIILITLTWYKNNLSDQGLNITFDDDPSTVLKLNTNTRLFRKLKGCKSLEFKNTKIEVFWDLSTARYESGPEPVDGFYVFIKIDSQLALVLGNRTMLSKKLNIATQTARFSLISRKEHFSGKAALYSTKARFFDDGSNHDILIRCSGGGGENDGLKYPVMSVTVDKKMVIRVKRLQWNFRGNQTIFLDGLVVDLMWDVHDWFYNPGSGKGVFLFRTRSGLDSRLWNMEEKLVKKDQDKVEFSLLIYACKNL